MRRILGAFAAVLLSWPACAETLVSSHGLSAFGDLKYPKDFTHFDYVNPNAPKGGTLRMVGVTSAETFDSFNPFILKGTPPEGLVLNDSDTGESLVFDSLMTRAGDEPDSLYGLVAERAEIDPDHTTAIFHLRKSARFHDGTQITAADVVFTVRALKDKGHPNYRIALRDVSVEAKDAATVVCHFAGTTRRDLPLIVAELPIASAAYYKTHKFEETSLDLPLGSGPYKVGAFKQGSFVDYMRVPDYWAADLPVNRGRWNFDRLRYEIYRDRAVSFQAFTAGAYDLREEFTSRSWATEYGFPAVRDGRVKRLTLPDNTPSGTQGTIFNTRRAPFKDPRLREALDLAFDFEWTDKVLFYGLYKRTASYFQNSDMMADGPPSPEELKLLEPFRAQLPAGVFTSAYVPPKTDGTGDNRANLRKASALLQDAGYRVANGRLVDAAGKPLVIELLDHDEIMADRMQPYIKNLRQLGIDASIRVVDPAQYELRRKTFDFDMTTARDSQRLTPGVELRDRYGSEAAAIDGSRNLAGIADPVVDALIEDVVAAKSRPALVTAVRALDRVLRAGHYWVSHWYKAEYNIAYWDKFARPATQPRYQRGIIDTWWVAPGKAK